jgi:uncharacterized iron-regulated membrane protein
MVLALAVLTVLAVLAWSIRRPVRRWRCRRRTRRLNAHLAAAPPSPGPAVSRTGGSAP